MSRILYLHELMESGLYTAEEICDIYLKRIEERNPQLNAYITVCEEEARKSAAMADDILKSGGQLPLLCGIPMAIKDNISTKGIRTTCASKMLEGYIPVYDASAWELLKLTGAVCTGKTNMDEFAMGSDTSTSYYGMVKNPYDDTKTAGGSSGGSAAAVAADMAVYALGTDTGGSVRQPASFCGVVGFKPSYGAVSRYGLIAYASSLDQIGIISKTVLDSAIVFDEIARKDPADSSCLGRKTRCLSFLAGGRPDITVGISEELLRSADDEICEVVMLACSALAENGYRIVKSELPHSSYSMAAYKAIAYMEASSNLARYDGIRYGLYPGHYSNAAELMTKSRSEGFGISVKERIITGSWLAADEEGKKVYRSALKMRKLITQEYDTALDSCDIIIAPTAPTAAFDNNGNNSDSRTREMADMCTCGANLAGLPAISVPYGSNNEGLPIGVQLIGGRFREEILFYAAMLLEKSRKEADESDGQI